MPYLDPTKRREMDAGCPPRTAGELTYCLVGQVQRYMGQTPLSYEAMATIMGAIEGAKLDIVDRIVLPYEAKKRQENGDVW